MGRLYPSDASEVIVDEMSATLILYVLLAVAIAYGLITIAITRYRGK